MAANSRVKKNDFIKYVAQAILSSHPMWRIVWEHKRWYTCVIGRELPRVCVFLSVEARPDRYWFGQGVGWAPSLEHLIGEVTALRNPDFKPTDGQLKRLLTLEAPRDFAHEYLNRNVGGLARPFAKYDLETVPAEALRTQMLADINEFAMPYLCLMLNARHNLNVTPQALATDAIPEQ